VITEPSVLYAEFSTDVPDANTTSVRVHPNPASAAIRVVSSAQPLSSIRILGTDGREVRMLATIGMSAVLDVSALSIGAYIIEAASTDGSVHRTRFIKQ
jgi:tetrahydrodipicolinate N-succinyltransferase